MDADDVYGVITALHALLFDIAWNGALFLANLFYTKYVNKFQVIRYV